MNKIREQIDRELREVKVSPGMLEEARRAAFGDQETDQGRRGHMTFGTGRAWKRKGRRTAVMAAVLVLACITAGAAGIFGNFGAYFYGDTEPYQDRILQSAQHEENDRFAMAVDGAVSDGRQCMFVFSLQALDSAGRKELASYLGKKGTAELSGDVALYACFEDGVREPVGGLSVFSWSDLQSRDFQSYVLTVSAENVPGGSLDGVTRIDVEYDGMVLTVDPGRSVHGVELMPEYAGSSLFSENDPSDHRGVQTPQYGNGVEMPDASAESGMGVTMPGVSGGSEKDPGMAVSDEKAAGGLVKDVFLSPIGFSFRGTGEDFSVWLIRSDGTLADGENDMAYSYGFSRNTEDNEVTVYGDFRYEIIDLEEYSGLCINGVNYYKTE
ncbi:hypothetical protein [Bacilliculturomica massiliensis]|uniref:hypothetical protein n=1 Tax=Bacilliculturomica massiliensis TaxID=1917867 RepID=UPI0010310599|nr:hypothetical protein [Bacilliculturomica massiliensis]